MKHLIVHLRLVLLLFCPSLGRELKTDESCVISNQAGSLDTSLILTAQDEDYSMRISGNNCKVNILVVGGGGNGVRQGGGGSGFLKYLTLPYTCGYTSGYTISLVQNTKIRIYHI